MPLNDYVEIGVCKGKKDEEQPLYVKKEKLTREQNTFEIVVDEMPTRAGIDPYNKLFDRIADDNMIDITKSQSRIESGQSTAATAAAHAHKVARALCKDHHNGAEIPRGHPIDENQVCSHFVAQPLAEWCSGALGGKLPA
jgi:hypothetical protein